MDAERLWALELPGSVAVAELEPLLDLPWWMDGAALRLSPAIVLARPGLHPDHDRRIEADLGFRCT